MVRCPGTGDLYVLNHLEYDANTLGDEYHRDIKEGLKTALPAHYFPEDDPSKTPINRWRPFAYLLMANWINDLYRDTPYDLETLGK
jgi:homoserine O-succinyltransferase